MSLVAQINALATRIGQEIKAVRALAGAPSQVSLDFGTSSVFSKTFSFVDASAKTTQRIVMVPCAESDEAEMDGFSCAAYCPADGLITVSIQAIPGPVIGVRKFNYTKG